MRTMDDRELVAAYVRDHSEVAFGEMVRRHLAWVYSVALRHVGNPALAEDVAQSVFVLLARKAGSLRSETVLGGWLFRTTRFVANRALRAERRRRTREETAASMIPSTILSDENEAIWRRLESCLDQAVASLSETDRQAILLRFYQKKSLLEVGRCLGLSEEAAKKRVSRAIQKMRGSLLGHGVAVGSTLLTGFMAEQTVQAAPSALATSVLKKAAVSVLSSGALPQLAQETLKIWRWTKLKMFGGLTASICGLAWLGFVLAPPSPAVSSSKGDPEIVQRTGQIPMKSVTAFPAAPANPTTGTEARAVHFQVLAKDSGEPISGAPLAVNTVSDEGWKLRFDLSTDDMGNAEIPYPRTTARLDVGVVASGWGARFVTWWTDLDGEIPTEYTLRVDRQTNFMGGWLKSENGEPVANAVVEMEFGSSDMAQEENPRERPGFVGPAPVARSDPNGWWSCAVVDPNAGRIPGLRARHPDFAPAQITRGSSVNRDQTQTQSMQLLWSGRLVTTMNRGVTLTGRITSEEGEFVGGARIEHEPGSFEPVVAESDSLGWFAIPGLPPGDFDFIVTAPGFAQAYMNVDVKEGAEPLQVRLKPGGILRLLLVDEIGDAVENATVALTGPAGIYTPGMNWSAQSGPDGRVEWTSAQTDSMLTISGYKLPEYGMSRTVVKADGEEHVIQLRRRFVVSGSVIDARTGELVQGEIKAFPGYGQGEDSWFRGETRRSTDGTFQVFFSEDRFPWRFRIEAEGYAPFVSDWVNPDENSVVYVPLQPTDPLKVVRGTVWRTDGQPAPGVQVALLNAEHGVTLGRARFTNRAAGDRLMVETDAAGNFAFPEEPHASLVVAVCSNGFARLPVGDLTTTMDIYLQPWGRLEGLIDASARSRPTDYVMVDDLLAMNSPGCLRLDSGEFHSKPTEDGLFAFDFVPQGLLCVWLSSHQVDGPLATTYHHPTWVQVTAGETSTVKVAEAGYRVKGRLVLDGGEGKALKQPAYAILDGEWPADSGNSTGLNTKQWMRSFFDLGRLIIEPDGRFESRDSIIPGTYRLLGKIESVRLDQPVVVPEPPWGGFSISGYEVDALEPDVVDLGDILIAPEGHHRAVLR